MSTLDEGEVNMLIPHDPANDPLQPDEQYTATWPSLDMCKACRGLYPAQATRRWYKGPDRLVARTIKTRLPGTATTHRSHGQAIPPCLCPAIEERQDTLEAILESLPADALLMLDQHHPEGRMWAATHIISRDESITLPWPRRYSAAQALEALRATGPDPDHPLQRRMLYAYSESAGRGTIWPRRYRGEAEIDSWLWAEVETPGTPRRQKASEYERERRARKPKH